MIIKSISLENFLIFRNTHVEFENGLNCIVGESGSGKSLLLNCLSNFPFSLRKSCIAPNCDSANLVLEVSLGGRTCRFTRTIKKYHSEDDLPHEHETLKELFNNYVVYEKQHGGLKILNSAEQLKFLDRFAGIPTTEFSEKFYRRRGLEERKNELLQTQLVLEEAFRIIEANSHLIELASELLHSGFCEFESCEQSFKDEIPEDLVNGIEASYNTLRHNLVRLSKYVGFDWANNLVQELDNCIFELLKRKQRKPILSKEIFYSIKFFIDDLSRLLKKTIKLSDLPNLRVELEKLISQLQDQFILIEDELNKLSESLLLQAREISESRKESCHRLVSLIEENLAKLGFSYLEIVPVFKEKKLDPSGFDVFEFLVTFNKGLKPQPLRKVASGGELNRFLVAVHLASKSVVRDMVFLFDEIDSGLSEKSLDFLIECLLELGKNNQVIIVTHNAERYKDRANLIRLEKIHGEEFSEVILR
ncbi:MAG: AAA family ATPase [Deltaproteobacteria bacterium]|nr:AAA family ATPase [Deltaproteobacteria bacterium]